MILAERLAFVDVHPGEVSSETVARALWRQIDHYVAEEVYTLKRDVLRIESVQGWAVVARGMTPYVGLLPPGGVLRSSEGLDGIFWIDHPVRGAHRYPWIGKADPRDMALAAPIAAAVARFARAEDEDGDVGTPWGYFRREGSDPERGVASVNDLCERLAQTFCRYGYGDAIAAVAAGRLLPYCEVLDLSPVIWVFDRDRMPPALDDD